MGHDDLYVINVVFICFSGVLHCKTHRVFVLFVFIYCMFRFMSKWMSFVTCLCFCFLGVTMTTKPDVYFSNWAKMKKHCWFHQAYSYSTAKSQIQKRVKVGQKSLRSHLSLTRAQDVQGRAHYWKIQWLVRQHTFRTAWRSSDAWKTTVIGRWQLKHSSWGNVWEFFWIIYKCAKTHVL